MVRVVTSCSELVHLQLHLLLSVGIESAVVHEEKVSDDSFLHLRDGLQAPGVEQFPIEPVLDLNASISL